MTEEEEEEDSA